jgi:hypothetical protein
MKLLEMSTHEFAQADIQLCFWPVGTIEAHDLGPLGTDVIAPEKLANDLAAKFNALLLPTLPYGLVSSLAGHPGGMWMSEQTYRGLIFELLSSLAVSGVEQVILFNGHGGNTDTLSHRLVDPGRRSVRGVLWLCRRPRRRRRAGPGGSGETFPDARDLGWKPGVCLPSRCQGLSLPSIGPSLLHRSGQGADLRIGRGLLRGPPTASPAGDRGDPRGMGEDLIIQRS